MKCFEFYVATSAVSTNGGQFIPDEKLTYEIPEDAQELLGPILKKYGQDPSWYFDLLNFGRPPAPWAIVCLDKEYSIAGHVVTCRQKNSGIAFTQYTKLPSPIPHDFVPQVGVVILLSKSGLEDASAKSALFQTMWEGLKDCSTDRRWLLVVDSLHEDWLAQVVPGDRKRWLSTR